MDKTVIDNGFFAREADAVRDASLLSSHPGEHLIREEISDEYKTRFLNNPDLPPMFLVAAQEDFIDLDLTSADVYKAVSDMIPAELHIYARTQHGFGVGICDDHSDPDAPSQIVLANASRWPDDADIFLKSTFGI